jgi:hypothetical protein
MTIDQVKEHLVFGGLTDHELGDNPMEDGAVVIAIERVLNEVAACQWSFLRPQLNVDVTKGRVKADLSIRRRFQIVHL